MERGRRAILALSGFSNLARFRFLYLSKPLSAPFQTRSCPFLFPFLVFLVLPIYHIQICATSRPTIGPRRTITGPRDQWEVYVHGDETLGTSMRNMSAPTRGRKRSSNIMKASALAVPHSKKRIRLNGPDERRGRATPNRNCEQEQGVHRDSRKNLHKAEGDRKHDGQ